MKKMILLGTLTLMAASLSACTAIQGGATLAGNYMCANADTIRQSLLITIQNAAFIENVMVRQMVISGSEAQLNALNACPTTGARTGALY